VLGGNVICVFCRGCIEDRNHLFFACSFCKRFWLAAIRQCLIADPPWEWDDIIARGSKDWSGKGLRVVLCKLCSSASVFFFDR
jgi:hypothetical protein